MKIALWIVGVPVGLFVALVISAAIEEKNDNRSPFQKIEDACNREFKGQGEAIITDCKIRLGIKRISDQQADALERAERRSR